MSWSDSDLMIGESLRGDATATASVEDRLRSVLTELGVRGGPSAVENVNFPRGVIWARRPGASPAEGPSAYVIGGEATAAKLASTLATYLDGLGMADTAARVRLNHAAAQAGARAAREMRAAAEPAAREADMTDAKDGKEPAPAGGRGIRQRLSDALAEGARRAPVELALEEGQRLLVSQLMRGFTGSRGERAAARKFLTWFMSTPAGQVALAGAISAGAPLVAGLVGRDGPVVQKVADEFAARAATITTREGMRFAASQLKPLLALFSGIFEAVERSPRQALGEPSAEAPLAGATPRPAACASSR